MPIDSIFWVHSDSVLNNTCSHNYTYVISLKRSNTGWLHCWNSIFPRHESKPCYTTPFPPLPIHHHLKGTVQRDFRSTLFSLSNLPEPLTNGLKKLILVKISWSYSNFRSKQTDCPGYDTPWRLTRQGKIPWGARFWRILYWLAGVWYSGEIDSPGYHTLGR